MCSIYRAEWGKSRKIRKFLTSKYFSISLWLCHFSKNLTVVLLSSFICSVVLLLASSCNEIRTPRFFQHWLAINCWELDHYCKNLLILSLLKVVANYITWCLLKEKLCEWSKSCSEVGFSLILFLMVGAFGFLRSQYVDAGFILGNSRFLKVPSRNLPYLNFVLRKRTLAMPVSGAVVLSTV